MIVGVEMSSAESPRQEYEVFVARTAFLSARFLDRLHVMRAEALAAGH